MAISFQWDPKKAEANWRKHKVSFEQARDAFKDLQALDVPDDKDDYGEDRSNLTGMVEGRLLVITYTHQTDANNGDEIIRIISARKAERSEARKYHEA